MIQINYKLSKSRNPVEHGFKLEGQQGEIIQALDDGYNLVKFEQFKIKKQIKVDRKVKYVIVPLEWYIHTEDLKII